MKIMWKNKFSGETGYVKSLNRKQKYFENTFNVDEAKVYSAKTVEKTIQLLNEYCDANIYEAIPA